MKQSTNDDYIEIEGRMLPLNPRRKKVKNVWAGNVRPGTCLRKFSCLITSLERDSIELDKSTPKEIVEIWDKSMKNTINSLKHTNAILRRAMAIARHKRDHVLRMQREAIRVKIRCSEYQDKVIEIQKLDDNRKFQRIKHLKSLTLNGAIKTNLNDLITETMVTVNKQINDQEELTPMVSDNIDLCDFFGSPESPIDTVSETTEAQFSNVSIYAVDNMLKSILTNDELVQLGYYDEASGYHEHTYTLVRRDSCVSTFQGELLTDNGPWRNRPTNKTFKC
jgi:hypothetical protein